MRVILIGGPACGKGVQANMICEKYGLMHIGTGELLRDEIKSGTENSNKLKELIASGSLVPDELVCDLVKSKVATANGNYLLDGFPRTMNQAINFNDFDKVDLVILLETDFDITLKRVLNRRICLNCKASLSVDELKNGHCPHCSGTVSTRIDDNAEVFKNRYEIYKMQSAPLIKYYDDMGVLVRVQNNNSIDETFNQVKNILSKFE